MFGFGAIISKGTSLLKCVSAVSVKNIHCHDASDIAPRLQAYRRRARTRPAPGTHLAVLAVPRLSVADGGESAASHGGGGAAAHGQLPAGSEHSERGAVNKRACKPARVPGSRSGAWQPSLLTGRDDSATGREVTRALASDRTSYHQ